MVKTLIEDNIIGSVVISKAGRDKGKYFIIIGVLNSEYVLMCNGILRTIEKPKQKKLKHLVFTDLIAEEIKEKILTKDEVSNSDLKKYLQSNVIFKEV
jgi:ribosomal protein L14E/L6E/L27E